MKGTLRERQPEMTEPTGRQPRPLAEPLGRVCRRLGIEKRITPYAFRRTINTQGQGVVPDAILRKVVAHSNATMTERYTAPDLAMRRQLGEGVFEKVFS